MNLVITFDAPFCIFARTQKRTIQPPKIHNTEKRDNKKSNNLSRTYFLGGFGYAQKSNMAA